MPPCENDFQLMTKIIQWHHKPYADGNLSGYGWSESGNPQFQYPMDSCFRRMTGGENFCPL